MVVKSSLFFLRKPRCTITNDNRDQNAAFVTS